jgi:hypothetical protein
MKMNWLAVPVIGIGLALSGCSHFGSHSAAEASGSAAAHAAATSSAAAEGRAILKACAPKTPLAQLTWLKGMASRHGDGPATRAAFASCAGVPHSKSKAFENEALTAAEKAVESAAKSKQITLKEAGKTYIETTLPTIVVKYRG